MRRLLPFLLFLGTGVGLPSGIRAQDQQPVTARNDSVSIRLVDTDLRAAVQALARYLDRPVMFGAVGDIRVTLETPQPVPRQEVPNLLRALLESQNLRLVEEYGAYRVAPSAQEPPPAVSTAGAPVGDVQLYVIRLRHARAADVAATVNALYGQASALGEIGARPQTLSQGLTQNQVPSLDIAGQQPTPVVVGQMATLSGQITIVPDTRTNSLLIRAGPGDFALIQAAVEQIDVRPLQVLIEVLIAEVRRDRGLVLGVGAELPPTRIPGSTDTDVRGGTTGVGLGDFALEVMNFGGVNLDVTLRAAATRGDVTILSRPVLLAANNQQAQILVGTQRPFVQVQRALPTDAAVRDQVVQYKDVGTQLTVRPSISGDGYVLLEVTQEVNAATSETAFDAPVISTRTVQTQLLIRDGHTAVLGGLADRQRDAIRAGVPYLSSIPLLGWLFGRTSRRAIDTELFLFLTPRVIRSDEELDETSREIRQNSRYIRGKVRKLIPPSPVAADSIPPGPPAEEPQGEPQQPVEQPPAEQPPPQPQSPGANR
jgi:type II secretory pathway component GspD/PulD (secretin)